MPRTIGHVDTQLDSRLLDCIDLRAEAARIEILECRPQPGYVDRPVLQIQFYQRGQQVRRLDQTVFRGLPVAGIQILRDAVGEERERQDEDAEQPKEDPVARRHGERRSSASA